MQKTAPPMRPDAWTSDTIAERSALARTLRDLRVGAGLSQQVLGARLSRPQSYVSKIESAQRRVELGEIQEWARACGKVVRWSFVEQGADDAEPSAPDAEAPRDLHEQGEPDLLSTLTWLLPRLSAVDRSLLYSTIRYLMAHQESERP